MSVFLQMVKSKEGDELNKRPFAWALICLIARRACRETRTALIGDYKAHGMTKGQYRAAKKYLDDKGYCVFHSTNKGTIAKLLDERIFDINVIDFNDTPTTPTATPEATPKATPENEPKIGIDNTPNNTQSDTHSNPITTPNNNKEDLLKEKNNKKENRRASDLSKSKRFSEFWKLYPKRNGRKLGKTKSAVLFNKFSISDIDKILTACENYAVSGQMAKDPERFLKADYWKDWLTPATNIQEGINGKSKIRAWGKK